MHYTKPDVYEFISKQTDDPIVDRKTCAVSGTKFPIFQSDLDFYDKISPSFGEQTFQIPIPTLCPEERQRRRLSFRNERKLYRRKCDASQKDVISLYSPDKPYRVFDQKIWRSDERNPLDYGRDFDFSKTFTENFAALLLEIPFPSLLAIDNENSERVNFSSWNKNCYLVFESDNNSNCLYLSHCFWNKNCVDCEYCSKSERLYQCNDCVNCHYLLRSERCLDCSQSAYLSDCQKCEYCLDCQGLVNKQYYYQNQPVSPEKFEQLFTQHTVQEGNTYPRPATYMINCSHSFGGMLHDSQHTLACFDSKELDHCKYISDCEHTSYCMDIDIFGGDKGLQYSYEGHSVGNGIYHSLFCDCSWEGTSHTLYTMFCHNSSFLFGSYGLRNKQYCVFNKQYSQQEYEMLVAKIIAHMQETGEWGEFLNPSLSPFGYNETVSQDYYPLESEQATDLGFKRSEYNYDINLPAHVSVIKAKEISDQEWELLGEDDAIISKIILCEISEKPFRITTQELEFYRQHNLPLPRVHPDIRHTERLVKRPERNLYLRKCDKTGEEIVSVHSSDAPCKVYSEEAWREEIYK